MNKTTFTSWEEINKMSAIRFMLTEEAVMALVDATKLAAITEEDGGLIQIEGIRFTPGGNFVKALTGSGRVVETAIELVEAPACNCETARAAYGHWLSCEKCAIN